MTQATLWHIELSHYSEKARWALDYKGVPWTAKTPMPGAHRFTALWLTRGKHDRLPILEIDGGRSFDSTAIIADLEGRFPEPALYPADPAERARALALEEFFDEELGPDMRRWVWHQTLPDTEAVIGALYPTKGDSTKAKMMRSTAPVARRLVRSDYDINDATADASLAKMRAAMDRIESELDGGEHLVGDSFSVADLTACALFTPLIDAPGRPYMPINPAPRVLELQQELSARPGGQWIEETYRRYRSAPA